MPNKTKATSNLQKEVPLRKRSRPEKPEDVPVARYFDLPKVGMKSLAPKQGGCERVHGIDFVSTILSGTSATSGTWQRIYALNSTLFPRLSQEAALFERYHFHKLRIWIFGKSASTIAGSMAMTSAVNDGLGGSLALTTETQIKNLGNSVETRGQGLQVHEVESGASGLKWLVTDSDAVTAVTGAQLGLLIYWIDATPAAGDLKFSVYVEYDVEFDIRTAASSNNFQKRLAKMQAEPSKTNDNQVEISQLRKKLELLEKEQTSG